MDKFTSGAVSDLVGGKKSSRKKPSGAKKPAKPQYKAYNGRMCVVHVGARGGKYIIVRGSKVYM